MVVGISLLLATGCGSFTAQSHNAAGVRLFDQAQYEQALEEFQEASYTDPANPDGYYNVARTFHRLGRLENRKRDLDQAESFYRQCLGKDPDHCDCYRGLAVLLCEQGRTDEAFELIKDWADSAPSEANARIELARLCQEYGNPTAAKEHLLEALEADPKNARALAALGKIREDMGERADALRNYQRSLANDRFQPQVAARIAALQSTMGSGLSMRTPHDGTRLVDRTAQPLR